MRKKRKKRRGWWTGRRPTRDRDGGESGQLALIDLAVKRIRIVSGVHIHIRLLCLVLSLLWHFGFGLALALLLWFLLLLLPFLPSLEKFLDLGPHQVIGDQGLVLQLAACDSAETTPSTHRSTDR